VASITSQKDVQRLQDLPFCYLCGKPLLPNGKTNRDHVPPRSIFVKGDRGQPLILPTHTSCNGERNLSDDRVRHVFDIKRPDRAAPDQISKVLGGAGIHRQDGGEPMYAMTNVDLRGEVERCLRAFHAALYRTPWPLGTRHKFETPFPEGVPDGNVSVEKPFDKNLHAQFVGEIRLNRATGNLDVVEVYEGKVRYECVWVRADDGRWICVFALDIDGWRSLADSTNFVGRGCAGCYLLPGGSRPTGATEGTRLQIVGKLGDLLDAFAPDAGT